MQTNNTENSDDIELVNDDAVRHLIVPEEWHGERFDKALSALCPDLSRARLQGLIKDGQVRLNGKVCDSAKLKIQSGDAVVIEIPEAAPAEPQPENIPLDVVFEDEHMLVINKPAGLVVHPGAGNHTGTLVNALLYHCGDSLSGIGGVARPGIVHRLDKETSGLMVVAKNDHAHHFLSEQLADRSLSRIYHALVFKTPVPKKGSVDRTVGRAPHHRLKMAAGRRGGKEAVTDYLVLEDYSGALSLVECRLQTGRTHQIRVHMEAIGHPLIGDPLYGPQPNGVRAALIKAGYEETVALAATSFERQALHAYAISFVHPGTEEVMEFTAEYPQDFSKLLKLL